MWRLLGDGIEVAGKRTLLTSAKEDSLRGMDHMAGERCKYEQDHRAIVLTSDSKSKTNMSATLTCVDSSPHRASSAAGADFRQKKEGPSTPFRPGFCPRGPVADTNSSHVNRNSPCF